MKNYRSLFLTLFFSISSVSISYSQSQEELRNSANKLAQALYYINGYYNDKVDNNKITDEAISKMMSQLDPHSIYVSAKDAKAMNEPLDGNFEGIGVEFAIIRDTLTVVNPVVGGPSERAGILPGDKIIFINGENVASINLTNEMVHKHLRGAKGTVVQIKILRNNSKNLLDFNLTRDKIPINSLDASYEVTPGVIYLKLSRFAATTAEEIKNAVKDLNIKNIKGLVLDLRGNGGGLLTTAFEVGDMFLDMGQTIVYTEGKRFPRKDTYASGNGFYKKGPLVILIDENSASASEIIAGAIQDWDRGVIIGRRSFGKGLVQQMMPFPDGSHLRLTIARYHTPSGRVIQKPYEAGNKEDYYKDINNRYSSGELFHASNLKLPDSLKFKTLIKGKTVYGGGGISPDVFVPADTSDYSDFFMNLVRKGVVTEYANIFTDRNRVALNRDYPSFNKFINGFSTDNKFMEDFYEYSASKGVPKDESGIILSGNRLQNYLKALIARALYDNNAYFKIINSYRDEELQKALEYIDGTLKVN